MVQENGKEDKGKIPDFNKDEKLVDGYYSRTFQTVEGPQVFKILVSAGVAHMKVVDAQKYTDYSQAGFRRRVERVEEEEQKTYLVRFGEQEIWLPIDFIMRIFFTPHPVK
jgi:hypothetical protein